MSKYEDLCKSFQKSHESIMRLKTYYAGVAAKIVNSFIKEIGFDPSIITFKHPDDKETNDEITTTPYGAIKIIKDLNCSFLALFKVRLNPTSEMLYETWAFNFKISIIQKGKIKISINKKHFVVDPNNESSLKELNTYLYNEIKKAYDMWKNAAENKLLEREGNISSENKTAEETKMKKRVRWINSGKQLERDWENREL